MVCVCAYLLNPHTLKTTNNPWQHHVIESQRKLLYIRTGNIRLSKEKKQCKTCCIKSVYYYDVLSGTTTPKTNQRSSTTILRRIRTGISISSLEFHPLSVFFSLSLSIARLLSRVFDVSFLLLSCVTHVNLCFVLRLYFFALIVTISRSAPLRT